MQKHNFFVKQKFFQDEVEILAFFDGDDDFGDDDEDDEDDYRQDLQIWHESMSRYNLQFDDNEGDNNDFDDDDDGNDDKCYYSCKSVNFQARPPDLAWKQIQIISNR